MALLDPTGTLPDETLAHIFLCARTADPACTPSYAQGATAGSNYGLSSHGGASRLGWLRVSFVSSRWRRVAIDEARLWAEPNFELGPQWVEEFILRSKGALLDISCSSRNGKAVEKSSQLVHIVHSQHDRLRYLQFSVDDNVSQDLARPVLENDFPFLEDFNFNAICRAVGGWSEALTLLSKNAPRLQRLRLVVPGVSYLNINWEISGFSALKRLDLEYSKSLPDAFLPHLLDILRRMPLLAELCLSGSAEAYTASDCTERCASPPTNEIHVIDLTQLKKLKITQALESYTHFLRHIRIPGTTHVVIDDVYTSDLSGIQMMCAHLSFCMIPPLDQQPPFLSATVKCIQGYMDWGMSNPDKLELWLRREVDTMPVDPEAWFWDRAARPNHLRLSLIHGMFSALAPIIDVRCITTLTLDGHTKIAKPWPIILAFESVETLHLICQSNQSSQPAGIEVLRLQGGSLPFPKLRYLTLRKYFMPDIVYDLPTHLVRQPSTLLEDIIYERRAQGAALRTVDVPIRETIRKLEAGEWNTVPDLENVIAAAARIRKLAEVQIVGEHSYGMGLY